MTIPDPETWWRFCVLALMLGVGIFMCLWGILRRLDAIAVYLHQRVEQHARSIGFPPGMPSL